MNIDRIHPYLQTFAQKHAETHSLDFRVSPTALTLTLTSLREPKAQAVVQIERSAEQLELSDGRWDHVVRTTLAPVQGVGAAQLLNDYCPTFVLAGGLAGTADRLLRAV